MDLTYVRNAFCYHIVTSVTSEGCQNDGLRKPQCISLLVIHVSVQMTCSDHHGPLSSEMSGCMCLGILYLYTCIHSLLVYSRDVGVYIVQVIYRESKMEPDATVGNELYFQFAWDTCHATNILLHCQKSASEKLYAQLSPENQTRAPRLYCSQSVYFVPRQVKFITF